MSKIYALSEDPKLSMLETEVLWVGDRSAVVMRLVDENGSAVDVTTGTLAVTYINAQTGAAYTFPSGTATITKQYPAEGVISILPPSAYPTAGVIRISVSFTNGATIRRFGPLYTDVLSL
ncbi:hypothetical protein UFOVP757_17 [uncultured Caudovirales phage]|uniref:BppU N-terminal domain-containing protein n=1 Tax=uncultured Caudovirales phage TaxID=2100421 RepID=A0A6J7X4Z9_9CAUD|nr:hypothetical protein UFOVP757_17 [uncultured Caudovirales phage]